MLGPCSVAQVMERVFPKLWPGTKVSVELIPAAKPAKRSNGKVSGKVEQAFAFVCTVWCQTIARLCVCWVSSLAEQVVAR